MAVVGEGNKIDIRQVKPGERIGSEWIISEGLKPGESIVVEGTQKVKAGAVVKPKPFDTEEVPTQTQAAPEATKPETKG